LLFLAAIGSIQGFTLYYLRDVIRLQRPAAMTSVLLGAVALFLLPSALGAGLLADRGMSRRGLVAAAGLVAAVGAGVLLFARGLPLAIVAGCILGASTGAFYAANWALGTLLAPPAKAGMYLGVSNLAGAGAGIIGAGIGGPIADIINARQTGLGYSVIVAIYAGLFLLSVLALARVREPSLPVS
jgi:MFS family permease